jgi:hypothetical protein
VNEGLTWRIPSVSIMYLGAELALKKFGPEGGIMFFVQNYQELWFQHTNTSATCRFHQINDKKNSHYNVIENRKEDVLT